MKVVGYEIYGRYYCLECVHSLDLDAEEEAMEPIFSGDLFPYPLVCEECSETFLKMDDWTREEPEEEIIAEFEEVEEEKAEYIEDDLTCRMCPIRDICPEANHPDNLNGVCITGWYYDLEETEEADVEV
jgi:hypothetical protein